MAIYWKHIRPENAPRPNTPPVVEDCDPTGFIETIIVVMVVGFMILGLLTMIKLCLIILLW